MRELSQNVLDVAQNSVTAGATQLDIILTQSTAQQTLTIEIKDNGCGMTKEQLASVRDPFFYHAHHAQGRPGRAAVQDGGRDDGRRF